MAKRNGFWQFAFGSVSGPLYLSLGAVLLVIVLLSRYLNTIGYDTFVGTAGVGIAITALGISLIQGARIEKLLTKPTEESANSKGEKVPSELAKFVDEFDGVIDKEDLKLYFSTKTDANRDVANSILNFPTAIFAIMVSVIALDFSIDANIGFTVLSLVISMIVLFGVLSMGIMVVREYAKNNPRINHSKLFREYLENKRKF
jgi:hypothetical protein